MRALAYQAAYVLAVTVIAGAGVVAAYLLPIADRASAWGVALIAGHAALIAALPWLPEPTRRKDHR